MCVSAAGGWCVGVGVYRGGGGVVGVRGVCVVVGWCVCESVSRGVSVCCVFVYVCVGVVVWAAPGRRCRSSAGRESP